MKKIRLFLLIALMLGTLELLVVPVSPALAQKHTSFTHTYNHIDDEGLLQGTDIPQAVTAIVKTATVPVVHAVMFWMDGCPHCEEIIQNVLPPLYEKYGDQIELSLIEVVTIQDIDMLYQVAASYGLSKEQTGVPFLIIGDHVLVGSQEIPDKFPDLIEQYLSLGGVDWPENPNLNEFLTQPAPTAQVAPTNSDAVVRVTLFTTLECLNCQVISVQGLDPLKEQYGEQLEVRVIDIVTSGDVEYLYQVAAGYGYPKEVVDLPLLIIGNRVLMVDEIPTQLPALVEFYLTQGGVDFPSLPLSSDTTASIPTPSLPAATETPFPAEVASVHMQSNGFTLAIVILVGMVLSLLFAIGCLVYGALKNLSLKAQPAWQDWLIPVLCVLGLGVAAYLSYIEVTLTKAMCGPVGDCNTVQQSPYARLWGVLPIGVLGMAGYVAILAAWWAGRRKWGWISSQAPLALFGMTFFGTVFSAYLTYLEPFVIKAVCIWCITSAIILTLLMLLSLPPAMKSLFGDIDAEDGS